MKGWGFETLAAGREVGWACEDCKGGGGQGSQDGVRRSEESALAHLVLVSGVKGSSSGTRLVAGSGSDRPGVFNERSDWGWTNGRRDGLGGRSRGCLLLGRGWPDGTGTIDGKSDWGRMREGDGLRCGLNWRRTWTWCGDGLRRRTSVELFVLALILFDDAFEIPRDPPLEVEFRTDDPETLLQSLLR